MSYYKLPGGLKQHKFSLLQFWRPEVQNQSHWTKVRVLARLVPSRGSRGESTFQLPVSRGYLHSLACGLITPTSVSIIPSPSLTPTLLPLSYMVPCCYIGSTQGIQNNLPLIRFLAQSHLQSPFCLVR